MCLGCERSRILCLNLLSGIVDDFELELRLEMQIVLSLDCSLGGFRGGTLLRRRCCLKARRSCCW